SGLDLAALQEFLAQHARQRAAAQRGRHDIGLIALTDDEHARDGPFRHASLAVEEDDVFQAQALGRTAAGVVELAGGRLVRAGRVGLVDALPGYGRSWQGAP